MPAVGYWANNAAFRNALAEGKTSFGTAKTVEAMEAVVRNTSIQGTLSIIFVMLSIIVIGAALVATRRRRSARAAGAAPKGGAGCRPVSRAGRAGSHGVRA